MASLKRLLCCVPQYLATNNICGSNSLFTSFMVCYSKLASDSGIFCFFRNTWDDGIHNILILHLTLKKDCVDRVLWEFCHGYMFCNRNGTKCKPSSFEPSFHSRLEHLKHRCLLLISKETGVCEEFGVSRSFCRGTTSEAINRGQLQKQWNQSVVGGGHTRVEPHARTLQSESTTLSQFFEFSRHL